MKRIHPKDTGLKFARRLKKKKQRPSGPKEDAIQQEVENYLDRKGLRWLHIPDCVYRLCAYNSPTPIYIKKEISDYLKGVPDLLIFKEDKCLILELKRKNAKARQPQKKWLKGIKHYIPDTLQDAINLIDCWNS